MVSEAEGAGRMKKLLIVSALAAFSATLAGCGKLGVGGSISQVVGNWAQVALPAGCKVRQLAASDHTTAVLCEDGRVFH